ncbi:D-alanine--D-alanine ligase domain protein [uncultured Desulfobacterium sp.]|uniref:D-alanine--D-alanine ligase domain protein n=1 Tax=uncultured Desulfobacterium sp. TaxID=201089 RepID=A0A445MV29_9BACT|nr:D-alanine--D-alanine ligase domain protein [uncultured Desulfobacterium sp.]
MIIGLTYDLRSEYLAMGYTEYETAEFDRDDTIIAIERALYALGHHTDRIGHAKKLTERLVQGDRWDIVFNIAEGLLGIGREAQVPAILDLYDLPYTFSDPLVMSLTLHKGLTKQVIRQCGIRTPDFAVVEAAHDLEKISFDPPYFIKPIAEGTSKGISEHSVIKERKRLQGGCAGLIESYNQPVLVEKYLCGREFTVGVIGSGADAEALGTLEVILLEAAEKGVYSYRNKENCEDLVEYHLAAPDDPSVKEAQLMAIEIWKVLGCRDAGRVDFRCDEFGSPYFLEINPLAGLHPQHSDLPILCTHLGIPYVHLIHRILTSASKRIHKGESPGRKRCS